MSGEGLFIVLVAGVVIPAGIGALWLREHPGATGLARGALRRAGETYALAFRDARSLGWWVAVPAAFALANLAWDLGVTWLLFHDSPHGEVLLQAQVRLGPSGTEWHQIGRIFSVGRAMEGAILAPLYGPAGLVVFWVLLATLFARAARRRGTGTGKTAIFPLAVGALAVFLDALCTSLSIWFTKIAESAPCLHATVPYVAWASVVFLVKPIRLAGCYQAVSWILESRIGRASPDPEASLRRFLRTIPVFAVLVWLLSLRGLWGLVAGALALPPVFEGGHGWWLSEAIRWAWSLLWIAFVPLAMAVAHRGWSLREAWGEGRAWVRRRRAALLAALPLFWGPFVLIEGGFWLLGFPLGGGGSPPLALSAAAGLLHRIAFPVLSVLPVLYFFRVAREIPGEGERGIPTPPAAAAGPSPSGSRIPSPV